VSGERKDVLFGVARSRPVTICDCRQMCYSAKKGVCGIKYDMGIGATIAKPVNTTSTVLGSFWPRRHRANNPQAAVLEVDYSQNSINLLFRFVQPKGHYAYCSDSTV
jgi:hypothetical protein